MKLEAALALHTLGYATRSRSERLTPESLSSYSTSELEMYSHTTCALGHSGVQPRRTTSELPYLNAVDTHYSFDSSLELAIARAFAGPLDYNF